MAAHARPDFPKLPTRFLETKRESGRAAELFPDEGIFPPPHQFENQVGASKRRARALTLAESVAFHLPYAYSTAWCQNQRVACIRDSRSGHVIWAE
jgi:hypothetical protein